jgi:hypothetical protein
MDAGNQDAGDRIPAAKERRDFYRERLDEGKELM